MTALAADQSRANLGTNLPPDTFTAANNQVFFQGSVVILKSDGLAYVGVAYTTGSGFAMGNALFALDTTITANQGRGVLVQPGTFDAYDISSIAAVAEADRGKLVFLENDNTISLTNQGSTLLQAGRLHSISADGLTCALQFEVLR